MRCFQRGCGLPRRLPLGVGVESLVLSPQACGLILETSLRRQVTQGLPVTKGC